MTGQMHSNTGKEYKVTRYRVKGHMMSSDSIGIMQNQSSKVFLDLDI